MEYVHGIVDESLHSPLFENIEIVFNISQKLPKEHPEEILNVRSLEYSSPSRTRSTAVSDEAIKWAKAKACVYADSVLCVGRMEQSPAVAERRWKGQVGDLRMYSSYQDAVGIGGEATEFEWKNVAGFSTLSILQEVQGPDHFHVNVQWHSVKIRWSELRLETLRKSRITRRNSYQDIVLFWVQVRKRDGTVTLTVDSGTVQPTK